MHPQKLHEQDEDTNQESNQQQTQEMLEQITIYFLDPRHVDGRLLLIAMQPSEGLSFEVICHETHW